MNRKTAHIDIRVEPEVIKRIDAWRAKHRIPPHRSTAILYMIDQFLERGNEFEIRQPRKWAEPDLIETQWRAAVDCTNDEIAHWNAMEAICCDALGVEVPSADGCVATWWRGT
jgi:hypothetical protein